MHSRDMPLPLSYRADLLTQVMPALRAGECCSLIGVSGVGKSNLTRFMQRPDVQAAYWGDEAVWVIPIDTNSLIFGEQPDEFLLAELMIYRIIREVERRNMPADFIADLDRKHTHLLEQPNAQLALRTVERVCGRICEAGGIQLIFAFDQFEDLWRERSARLFLNLRYLRDEFKYRMAYLVMTRERLQRMRADLTAVEPFWELFTSHTYGLGIHNEIDATTMLDRIAQRRGISAPDNLRRAALDASGGHPGLLRAVFWALHDAPGPAADAADLLRIDAVAGECAKIWNDLLPEERQVVSIIASGPASRALDAPALPDLRLKQLVVGDPPALFSPLFGAYAQSQISKDMAGIVVYPRLRQVWIDGRPLEKPLSPLEFNLLEYLARHAGEVCERDDILRHLYNDQQDTPGDDRLDTLLRRLRETLGEDARRPRYLVTHRGVGFQLVNGRVEE